MTATTKQETITIARERLADIEGALAGVDEQSLTCGEDARHLLSDAIKRGALSVPDGLAVLIESDDDDEGCCLRLILTTAGPGGLEYSKGWDEVKGASAGGIVGALEHAASELNDILELVDPREPSTRAAILRAMRSVRKGGEVPAADLQMELAARYRISDEDLEQAEPPKPVSALLIPADEKQPARRIDVTGLDDLQAAVRGSIEVVSYHGDPDVCAYVNEEGNYTDGSARNPRATRLLGPGLRAGDWIAGDAVIVGFDRAAGEERDLPDGFESRLGATTSLRDPERTVDGERHVSYEWELGKDGEGARQLAVLSISHHKQRAGGCFTALVRNETVKTTGGITAHCFALLSATRICTEEVPRYSAKGMQEFAATALHRLRGLYEQGDPQVHGYFRVHA